MTTMASLAWLQQRLSGTGPPVIIDGGMGTELERAGVPMHGKVWSGQAVLEQPAAVQAVHESFLRVGAEVIIANTFAAARHMLEPGGLGNEVRRINLAAMRLAVQARDEVATGPVAIAGSICEWAPAGNPRWADPANVARSAAEQAELLAEGGADLIALEMCQHPEFSQAVVEAALGVGLPIWIGVSAMRHRGCDMLSVFDHAEVPLEPLLAVLAPYPAMLFNVMHTPVPDVEESLAAVRRHWDGPVGVYPESGYFTMPNWQFVNIIEADELAAEARKWVSAGVRAVGGCCGLGPDHVAGLRAAFIQ